MAGGGACNPYWVLYGVDDIKCLFPFSNSVMEGNATCRKTNALTWELIQDFNPHNDAL